VRFKGGEIDGHGVERDEGGRGWTVGNGRKEKNGWVTCISLPLCRTMPPMPLAQKKSPQKTAFEFNLQNLESIHTARILHKSKRNKTGFIQE
jgi:hypothetical protein